MQTQVHEASVAFTYAWWLTGDDAAAEAAVAEAARTLPADTDDEVRLAALLASVRRIAAPQPTMCPASELALLHDAQHLPLDTAARLVGIAPEDSTAQLAHGRLEALLESVTEPFAHPERLGGLAVGNPPDVAHARTCDSCSDAAALLRRGRSELAALPEIPAPTALLASGRAGAAGAADPDAAADPDDAADPDGEVDAVDAKDPAGSQPASPDPGPAPTGDPTEDAPTDAAGPGRDPEPAADPAADPAGASPDPVAEEPAPAPPRAAFVFDDVSQIDVSLEHEPEGGAEASSRRSALVGVGAVAIGVILLLITALTGGREAAPEQGPPGVEAEQPGGPGTTRPLTRPDAPPPLDLDLEQPDPASTASADDTPDAPAPTDAAPEPAPDAATEDDLAPAEDPAPDAGFSVTAVGVLPAGQRTAQPTGAAIAPADALRVAVRYSGAAEGVSLTAAPELPGEQAEALTVVLSSQRSNHTFLWPAPPEGWAPGRHTIPLLADGELVAVVDVTVAG
jgi:hypothetical protein